MDYLSTRQVARLLGVSVSLLTKAVWCGRVDPPRKSPSGNFLWTRADVDRASRVLCCRACRSQKRRRNRSTTGRNAAERAENGSGSRAGGRLPRANAGRKRARRVLVCVRNWLWRLLERVMNAFFDALFKHLREG